MDNKQADYLTAGWDADGRGRGWGNHLQQQQQQQQYQQQHNRDSNYSNEGSNNNNRESRYYMGSASIQKYSHKYQPKLIYGSYAQSQELSLEAPHLHPSSQQNLMSPIHQTPMWPIQQTLMSPIQVVDSCYYSPVPDPHAARQENSSSSQSQDLLYNFILRLTGILTMHVRVGLRHAYENIRVANMRGRRYQPAQQATVYSSIQMTVNNSRDTALYTRVRNEAIQQEQSEGTNSYTRSGQAIGQAREERFSFNRGIKHKGRRQSSRGAVKGSLAHANSGSTNSNGNINSNGIKFNAGIGQEAPMVMPACSRRQAQPTWGYSGSLVPIVPDTLIEASCDINQAIVVCQPMLGQRRRQAQAGRWATTGVYSEKLQAESGLETVESQVMSKYMARDTPANLQGQVCSIDYIPVHTMQQQQRQPIIRIPQQRVPPPPSPHYTQYHALSRPLTPSLAPTLTPTTSFEGITPHNALRIQQQQGIRSRSPVRITYSSPPHQHYNQQPGLPPTSPAIHRGLLAININGNRICRPVSQPSLRPASSLSKQSNIAQGDVGGFNHYYIGPTVAANSRPVTHLPAGKYGRAYSQTKVNFVYPGSEAQHRLPQPQIKINGPQGVKQIWAPEAHKQQDTPIKGLKQKNILLVPKEEYYSPPPTLQQAEQQTRQRLPLQSRISLPSDRTKRKGIRDVFSKERR